MRPKYIGLFLAGFSAFQAVAALQWEQRDGYRIARLDVPTQGRAGFTLLAPAQTGIHFTNQLGYDRSQANQNLLNGSGLAAGDFDGDGLCDLYFCNLEGANGLFRNKGDWTFENITATSAAGCTNQTSRGAVFADIDGDVDLDLLVSSLGGPNACLLNDGKGRFQNVTEASGLTLKAGCHSIALADIDADGDLDLYIANNGENSILRSGGTISVREVNGKPVVSGRHGQRIKIINGQMIELGEPDAFYLNDGKGRFQRLSWTDGRFLNEQGAPIKTAPWDQGLSVMFRDIDADGDPDIYVCNDFQTPDRIWMNDGKGTFRAITTRAIRSTCHFSMGVDFADIDRDGDDDFFVSDMLSRVHRLLMRQTGATNPPVSHVGEDIDRHQVRRNVLQLNRGDGTYADIANFAGVAASDWTWTVLFLDVDLDGYEDLLVANGHAYDTQDLDMIEKSPASISPGAMRSGGKNLKDFPPLETPNYAFRNRGDRTFEELGAQWGFDSTQISHGISLADLDNDGDQDLAVSCLWKAPLIYRNESTAPRVAVRLRGKTPNTQGIGAKIKVLGGAVPMQTQEIISGGRYLSGDDPMRVFAAGSPTNKLTIEVAWRNGRRSVVKDALPNHIYEIDEASSSSSSFSSSPSSSPRQPFFKDISERLAHTHQEPWFNDFDRQPLLHRQLSAGGPGVAWCDLDGDSHDELIIGASLRQMPVAFQALTNGQFKRSELSANVPPDDLTGLAAGHANANYIKLLAGISGYEDPIAPALTALTVSRLKAMPREGWTAATGPVATGDIDGDGDLDLFVGGRVVPGRYPEPASSRIYRNESGMEVLDGATDKLKAVGLVNGAVFSDLTSDGIPELILACEWGPIRVFEFKAGKINELTSTLGFPAHTGWWTGITTGDFDGDGRMDIVAGNWGLNSSYHQPAPDWPLRLYYDDFDANGSVDLVEAYTDPQLGQTVPRRDLAFLSTGLPLLRTRFKSHAAFSEAAFANVLGDQPARVSHVTASTLATTVFFNRTNKFHAVPLPDEAQFAPVFGVNVADFDGDGADDIFLAQNFFAMRPEEPRLDAGRGLWLKNDGKGNFTAVPGAESGVMIYGEQRGSAVGDFDGDARVDLVVAQNSGPTKLYHNQRARPGLRVRLQGSPVNPYGIGATVWMSFGSRQGPAREIHGGSGYWSQDSLTPLLGTPEPATALNVRWPGGKTTTHPIPPGTNTITVQAP